MADQNREPTMFHEIKVKGNQLVEKVREIIEEGNARSVSIKKDGRTVFTIPLSVGVGGAAASVLIAPTLAAIGAFVALATDVSLEVEHIAPQAEASETTQSISRASTVSPPPTESGL
ncbi:MAG TPA: DUF4342 domain-containing protein [Rhodothermales bacterium]|nr:DUF4342 domain-containing protein [Rhodothermales bacterium]